jgi:hypothetical protein
VARAADGKRRLHVPDLAGVTLSRQRSGRSASVHVLVPNLDSVAPP